jgi:hypothetical protein
MKTLQVRLIRCSNLYVSQIIEEIRHSVSSTALRDLPEALQYQVRVVYYCGIRYAFAASTGFAILAIVASCLARPSGLRSTK